MLSLDQLRAEAEAGTIDTVVTAFTDMQGRLVGKRIEVSYFLDEVTDHGVEGCNYLLALDMEMDPVPGYELFSWEKGYGDFGIVPDLATLRRIPWLDRTALVICDVVNHDGSPVVASPRQILIAQYERALEEGYTPMFASELEFYLYKQSYAQAHEQDYTDLTPTIPYVLDYHILATTMDENVLGPIRRGMHGAGIPVEFSKGEAWYGQHEVNTRYADAITSADRHTIYKNGVKEIAFLHGVSATFMAKPSEKDIGSSCHVHSSLIDASGASAFVAGDEETDIFRHYLGGQRARIRELALFVAPTINSYKRYASESWAPTRSLGRVTTARLDSGSSATGSRGALSAGSRAPMLTRISRMRRCWPLVSTGSPRAPTRDRSSRATRTRRPRPSHFRRRCAKPSICGSAVNSRARRSAKTPGAIICTTAGPNSGCSIRW